MALRDQKDLDALCAPRRPGPVERYWPNGNYGFANILKQYSGYPVHLPIWAVIPHGVYTGENAVHPSELRARVPAVLSYPAFRTRLWEATTNRVVIPSASPVTYATTMFRKTFQGRSKKEGTLFFPAHSTNLIETVADWGSIAEDVKNLDDEYHPVTVCVHWNDYNEGVHKIFKKHGFPIVSAGNFQDQEFMYRWLHLLSCHRYAASNEIGGCLYYAVHAGVPFRLVGESTKRRNRKTGGPTPTAGAGPALDAGRIEAMFKEPVSEVTSEQRETVDYLLGMENFKSPKELLADLESVAELAQRVPPGRPGPRV